MMQNYKVQNMQADDIEIACQWAKKEGWGPGIDDPMTFYQADPNGFFKGVVEDKIVSVGSMVCYDSNFAFSGLYIVHPNFRGQGFGLALTHKRLEYAGSRLIGLDGVVENVSMYQKIGYKPYHENHRFLIAKQEDTANHPHIISYQPGIETSLSEFDRQYFPAQRNSFLAAWCRQTHGHCLIYIGDSKIKGYGVIRTCHGPDKIGPLFAETPEIANLLLKALMSHSMSAEIYLDVPGNNSKAMALINHYKPQKVFSTIRMYRNGYPSINEAGIYGITTFELG